MFAFDIYYFILDELGHPSVVYEDFGLQIIYDMFIIRRYTLIL